MNVVASTRDTIAAVATPLGEGGLGVVRVSGPAALAVADRVFRAAGASGVIPSASDSHRVLYGHVFRAGRRVDEVLLTILRAPRTFTREDTVEISCHGGPVVLGQVLSTVLTAGARLALPGEFTQRAFLNGRLDLTQAEAVADLIHARTELAAAAALEQLGGRLSREMAELRDGLMKVLAHVEAYLDFPDEDISPDTVDQLVRRLEQAARRVNELQATAGEGQVLRRGVRTAIVGRPNAGKSSLLNSLLGHARSIVSPVAGTTRDTVEETANVRGIPVVFIDTAGVRETSDEVEAEGVRRSRLAVSRAELVLQVVDASEPLSDEDLELRSMGSGRPWILVANKSDLPMRLALPSGVSAVSVSCLTGAGLDALRDALFAAVGFRHTAGESVPLTVNARQAEALRRAAVGLAEAVQGLHEGRSLELIAIDLRAAVGAVGEVVGKTTTDDLLDAIFREFCLGK